MGGPRALNARAETVPFRCPVGLSARVSLGRLHASRRLRWHLHREPHSAICPSLLDIHQSLMRCLAPSLPPWPLGQHVDPWVTPSPAMMCPLSAGQSCCVVHILIQWHLPYGDGVSVCQAFATCHHV